MTLPARRRAPVALTLATAAAALLAGPLPAPAQQPSPTAAAPASAPAAPATPATPAAPAATPAAKKAPAKSAAAEGEASAKSAESYSLGLMWGEQLRNTGVTPDAISTARIAQGVRDAITGKVAVSDKDRENIRALATSGADANHRAAAKFLAENGKKPGVVTTKSGLQYQELKAGSGNSPKANDSAVVNYRGTLLDGTEFDSSYKRGEPATFEVDRVIPGWTEALQLMKPGAKWKLFIPPQLAYDLRSRPPIPPGSMLLFEVELVSVKPAPPASPPPSVTNAPGKPGVPASAAPKATGKPPVNPADSPNSPSPATVPPAPK
ncbi:MAG TPA: FKBP-type peptidyl-prolyl cis-trans isomerase [Steroidobacteraceae bacterium]|nr:FKBP-type peptidyl-prolyl cis-trans isomerase [Steroidobacteraceae bacterium]